ncbi:hypothetical protein Lal_00029453 [Lupinus albus]|uniref:Putative DnaJ domain-containing protein n=1 Tax=Lupinus albus TaxID=3870 RepID=A0A6A4MYG7_LUPAL|nr:putative DnaJ domain-containing protein [Lupinus albus]KAF1864295.1 hypothetical protein Lal_00029453 [Lupinus albus]
MHSYNLLLLLHHHHPGLFYFRSKSKPIPISVNLSTRNGGSGSWCENEMMSLYSVLGVEETVSFKEMKQAYKKMAMKYHPDVSPVDMVEENTKRFIKLKEAYETLSDPKTRAIYDTHFALALNFPSSSHYHNHQVSEQKKEWKKRWQSQLSELKRRSECTDNNNIR